jgi:hypothetical protein
MISFHELGQAITEAGTLVCITIIAHGIVTAAGRVFAAIAYGIAENVKK